MWETNYMSYMFSFLPQNNVYTSSQMGNTLKVKRVNKFRPKVEFNIFELLPRHPEYHMCHIYIIWISKYLGMLHMPCIEVWYIAYRFFRWEKNNIYVRRRYIKVIGNVIRSLVKLFGRKFRIELNLCYLYKCIISDKNVYLNKLDDN